MKIELDNIYNIDCLEGMKDIPDGSVDLVVTDPPYEFKDTTGGGAFGTCRGKSKEKKGRTYHATLSPMSGGIGDRDERQVDLCGACEQPTLPQAARDKRLPASHELPARRGGVCDV